MWWFAVPAVIGLGVAAVEYFSDDEEELKKSNDEEELKKGSNEQKTRYAYRAQQKNKLNEELKIFKEKERKRLTKKHKICQSCIFYPTKYRATYNEEDFFLENFEKLTQLKNDIGYINNILIDIKLLESKYDKQKKSR